ncbi:PKD domain-containing protein [bacterium]|nr:PKD domain-containing protein [bacterium]
MTLDSVQDQTAAQADIPGSESFPPPASDTPSSDELQAVLDSELLRLGLDERTGSQAPLGNDNAVFDLKVSYYDLQQGAVLHWTERHVGDYDMNGLVNASDLTPLAQRWKYTVDYREASEAGVPWWPVGNPRDGGFSGVLDGKPGFNTPADQWRTSRVDGDGNGEVNLGDITPIAMHWQQNLDSWRVYRRAPGEEEFSLLLPDPGRDYTIARSANFPLEQTGPDRNWAYRMHFADLDIIAGSFEYYIAAFDSISGSEGSPSPVASIEFVQDPDLPEPEIPGNKPPLASFTVDPRTGDLPLTVNFDASRSTDPDGQIVLYLWDFDGDGTADESGNNLPTVSHVYTEPGYWQPRLTIWDDLGSSATLYANLHLEISQDGWLPPIINSIGKNLETGATPCEVHFLPEIEVPAGKAGLLFEWDFDGDGVVDSTAPALDDGKPNTEDYVSHIYETAGLMKPHLKITDNRGMTAEISDSILVYPNSPPLAILKSDVKKGDTCLLVSFDFSECSDPDGDELSVSFRPDESLPYVDVATGGTQYLYETPGDHVASILVHDVSNVPAYAEVLIQVTGNADMPPVAVLTPNAFSEKVPFTLQLSAEDSYDPVGKLLGDPDWDLDGDGEYENHFGWTKSIELSEPGSYTFGIRVQDDCGHMDSTGITVEMFEKLPPVASLSAMPDNGTVPFAVTLDASASYDPAGLELEYWWMPDYYEGAELAGTEIWQQGTTQFEMQMTTAGKRNCAVMVRDHYKLYSVASVTVLGSGAGWNLSMLDGRRATEYAALDLEVVAGNPAIAYSACVNDRFHVPGHEDIRYLRAADPIGVDWQEPLVLEGLDVSGFRGTAPSLAVVSGRPAVAWNRKDGSVMYRRAADTVGNSWLASSAAFSGGNWNALVQLCDVAGKPALCFHDDQDWLRFKRADDADGFSWTQPGISLSGGDHLTIFRPSLLPGSQGPLMAYMNINWPVFQYRLVQAMDSTGATWDFPATVDQSQGTPPDLAMIENEGILMLAYYTADGLVFRRATDETGTSWNDPVLLPEILADPEMNHKNQMAMKLLDGKPVILDRQMFLRFADDAAGLGWSSHESIPGFEQGICFDLEVIDGHPAIAFQTETLLFYAIKLP